MTLSGQVITATANALKKSIKPFTTAAAGEISGLIGDQIRFQRWKNATRILERAKLFCTRNRIPTKDVPLKFIVPFLDAASLEDPDTSEKLVSLWASLLASTVKSKAAKSTLFIDKLRALSSAEALELSRLVRHLLKERNPNVNQFRDEQFDPDSWNIDLFEEFRFHFQQELSIRSFSFKELEEYRYSVKPEPTQFIKAYIKKWSPAREDFFIDYYSWSVFNSDGFYGGASFSDSMNLKLLSLETIDTLVALGFIIRNVQTFRVSAAADHEVRFDLRLGALTTLGTQFLRATHVNEFNKKSTIRKSRPNPRA